VSIYMCVNNRSWYLLQTPCLSRVYQGTGRRESSFPTWHISIKGVKLQRVCVCVSVKGWRKLYSLTGDHFSGQSWFYRLYWCWSVCLPVVIPQAALCTVCLIHACWTPIKHTKMVICYSVYWRIVCYIKFIFYSNWITNPVLGDMTKNLYHYAF